MWITVNTQCPDCKAAFLSPAVIILHFHHFSTGYYQMLSSAPLHINHSSVTYTHTLYKGMCTVQSIVHRKHAVMHSQFLLFQFKHLNWMLHAELPWRHSKYFGCCTLLEACQITPTTSMSFFPPQWVAQLSVVTQYKSKPDSVKYKIGTSSAPYYAVYSVSIHTSLTLINKQ